MNDGKATPARLPSRRRRGRSARSCSPPSSAAQWRNANRVAIEAYNAHIAENGVLSDELRRF